MRFSGNVQTQVAVSHITNNQCIRRLIMRHKRIHVVSRCLFKYV